MDRRTFFRNAALLVAGCVAEDQLEVLARLTHQRKSFPSAAIPRGEWVEYNGEFAFDHNTVVLVHWNEVHFRLTPTAMQYLTRSEALAKYLAKYPAKFSVALLP